MGDGGAQQESRSFSRSMDSLGEIFDFIERFLSAPQVAREHLLAVEFVVEELFTNQVKYAAGNPNRLEIRLRRDGDVLAVSLTDFDAEPFDVRAVDDARVDLPIEKRRPGGLGIHLLKRMVDGIDYEYVDRRSTTTFTRTLR